MTKEIKVHKDDSLIGVESLFSGQNIIQELNSPIRDCMRTPITVSPRESVSSLLRSMIDNNIGAVIVVEKERPVGIITEKDVLEKAIIKNKDVYKTKAEDVMSKPLISIESDRSIKEAIELMRKHNIRRLAVLSNGVLVGLVTERRLAVSFLNKITADQ